MSQGLGSWIAQLKKGLPQKNEDLNSSTVKYKHQVVKVCTFNPRAGEAETVG